MARLEFHGSLDTNFSSPLLAAGLDSAQIRPRASGRVQRARADSTPQAIEAQDDDLVEIELDGGLRMWSRVDTLAADFGLRPSRGGSNAIELPTLVRTGGASRGIGEWLIKGFKVFGLDVPGKITDFVKERVEGKLRPGPGLYRCTSGAPSTWESSNSRIDASGPTLVFLHGTASSTDGSFGGLWDGDKNARIQQLLAFYGGRVLAFQHRTLSESPIENARALCEQLAKILPAGAELHLVSHSRGGLVGELLTRCMRVGGAPFDDADLALFDPSRTKDLKALEELDARLSKAKFAITRFVRVACPARGTTLADRRLDRYFSVFTNVVGLLPGMDANPVFQGLTGLLGGVLKKRTDPEELPGLEAMMPGSALVLMLNRTDVQTRAALHVIGGDLEGTGLIGRLKTLATDFFYRDDHDLVVNTPSMFGGCEREDGKIRYWIDTGNDVTHFNYFRRSDTAKRLVSALTGSEAADDFHVLEPSPAGVTSEDYRKRAPEPQPIVFVLPGIMGSTLEVDHRRVWIDKLALFTSGMTRIRAQDEAEPKELVADDYKALCRELSLSHEVVPFPYDWRKPVTFNAERLAAAIKERLPRAKQTGQPIRILAHSMGGLVARTMIGTPKGAAIWKEMCEHPGARLVMLGTPNGGSYSAVAMLLGRDALTSRLALLDLRHSYADMLAIIAEYDGVLNLLPHAKEPDYLDAAIWKQLFDNDAPIARGLFSSSVATSKSAGFAWAKPSPERLKAARDVRDLLQQSPIDPARMIYVAGCSDETPCAVEIDPSAPSGRRVSVRATAYGDGRVPWATGIPAALEGRTYYMDVVHGDLANAEEHFPALLDLLNGGATTKLSKRAPARRSPQSETFPLSVPPPAMLPDEEELVTAALGSTRRRRRVAATEKVRVRVVHGNLSRAKSAVVVGHYQQDVLVSAEKYLDRQLDGRLEELHRMELYPGAIGTAEAILNEPGRMRGLHPGAVVVGLGNVGELTPGKLAQTLTHGLTIYGSARIAQERRRRQREPEATADDPRRKLSVTALLIGSGESGVSLSDSVQAVLRAVVQANERLAQRKKSEDESEEPRKTPHLSAFLAEVEILELYEDRAIQSARTLKRLAQSQEIQRNFQIDEFLARGEGGEVRTSFEEDQGWWQRVRISSGDKDGLKSSDPSQTLEFEAVTARARGEARKRVLQRSTIEKFLTRASGTTAKDPTLGYTLFEHLIPQDFKEQAPDRRMLALMLDEGSARYPWELMHDRFDRGAKPVSVETGMIRQLLLTVEARRHLSYGDDALVVGDPPVLDPRFVPLPGAREEAAAVADLLSARGYETTALIGEDATMQNVLTALYEKPWRVMHLAAHGVFEFQPRTDDPAKVTGMALEDGFLTPGDLGQLRYVPQLVFVNCCHGGNTSGDARRDPTSYHQLAANLATQLIRMGAKAVVAAGWAVDDEAAKTFATTLYQAMLDGVPFGDAVKSAREAVWVGHQGVNTWGAYQCYGDPSFRLRQTSPTGGTGGGSGAPVAPREACVSFDTIAQRARNYGDREGLLQELDTFVQQCQTAWFDEAAVSGALATAYVELGEFTKARQCYERALKAEPADLSLASVEQHANAMARAAESALSRSGKGKRGAHDDDFERATKLLEALLAIGPSGERFALLGSLHKRRAKALVADADARRDALRKSSEAYGRAFEIKIERGDGDPWYPLLNQIGVDVVLSWSSPPAARKRGEDATQLDGRLTRLEGFAVALADTDCSFWELALGSDALLLKGLHARALSPADRREIEDGYRNAMRRGGSAKELDSVSAQIRFFEQMLASELPDEERRKAPLLELLKELRTALEG